MICAKHNDEAAVIEAMGNEQIRNQKDNRDRDMYDYCCQRGLKKAQLYAEVKFGCGDQPGGFF